MVRSDLIRFTLLLGLVCGLWRPGLPRVFAGRPAQAEQMDPKSLTPEQKELLNYAYLTFRPDLLAAINATGAQRVVVRSVRMGINYIQTLERTREGEARLQGGRGGGPGMIKLVLQDLTRVCDALSDEQRQAFAKVLTDQKLEPVTVDATAEHFLYRYTFAPGDRVEKAKARDGRILDVVVPEKDDINKFYTELKTGDDLLKVLENPDGVVRRTAADCLIQNGSAGLDNAAKKSIAEIVLTQVEKGEASPDSGAAMQAYSKVAQPEHENRVFAQLEKCSIHTVAGMVAAYAAVAPAKALDYIAKPRTDKNYPIRAVQGLGMAPDAMRLLQSALAKMPDMKWKINEEIKNLRDREKARAEGKPENPGLAELEARRKAQKEAEEKAREGKKPGEYQGFNDWYADLSNSDRRKVDKAARYFTTSVYAVDLATVTPQQRASVFKIAYAAMISPKTTVDRQDAGKILIASADPKDSDALVGMIKPNYGHSHFALAALIRVDPANAERVLLSIENIRFQVNPVRKAADLVPAPAVGVLESTLPKLKFPTTKEWYGQMIADLKKAQATQ